MERAPGTCILCGCQNRSLLFQKEEWTVFRCCHCGLAFLDPRPTQAELGTLYKQCYFHEQYGQGLAVESLEMRRRISQEDHRVKFFRPYKKNGRVVDCGCGLGYFLHACRFYGYDVSGVDISDYASSYVKDVLRIPIQVGGVDEIQFENASIDVVTMWHFLEHTSNPRDYLKQVALWLKPGGLLVVDVPNYRGTDAQKYGNHWVGWQVPYHLFHFTPETIKDLLAACGFITIRTKDYHSEYIKNSLKRISGISLFARLIAKGFSGTSYAVVARKTGSSSK